MKTLVRLLIPVALLQVLACSDSADPPSEDGSGGSSPDETVSSSASSGAGDTPVACGLGEGAPPGAACAEEGEHCDYACSSCWLTCTGGVWVEHCSDGSGGSGEGGSSDEGDCG